MRIINNNKEWDTLLKKEFGEYDDTYFTYKYFELYGKQYNAAPEGIFWEDENIKIFWTHLVRDIGGLECFKELLCRDLTTPYGYGGPLAVFKTDNQMKTKESLGCFLKEYEDYARSQNYVCEFIRFHPIFKNQNFFDGIMRIRRLNDVVEVDLGKPLEEMIGGFRKGHRYNIKKSIRESCQAVIVERPAKKNITDFSKIYRATMDRNHALGKYYFSEEFIENHFKMPGTFFVEIWHKGNIICSSMFLVGPTIAHYYLSGSAIDSKGLYPSSLAIWEAIKFAKDKGCLLFQLGGGVGANDSLFDFKKGFSEEIAPFYVGEMIFDQAGYQSLVGININNISPQSDYFPAYRCGLEKRII